MPVPSAFGSTFSARQTAFDATYNAGTVDLGTSGGVYVHGWVFTTGSGNATTNADAGTSRPGPVTVGGVALTVSTPQDRNTVFGAGSAGWVSEVFGFVPSLTGVQAVVANKVTATGAASANGLIRLDLQVYTNVNAVPVKNAVALTTATAGAITTAFSSAVDRLDVMSVHTSMSQASTPAMTATGVAPSTLRSAPSPLVNAAVIADRASAASTSLTVNTSGSFGFAYVGAQLSLAGTVAGPTGPIINTHPAAQSVTAGSIATFTVSATASGGGFLSYQWRSNGVAIGGAANAPSYSRTTSLADDGMQISVVVTESGGTNPGGATSNNALLTVTPVVTPPPTTQYTATVGPLGEAGIPVAAGRTVYWTLLRGFPGSLTTPIQGQSTTQAGGTFVVTDASSGAAFAIGSLTSPSLSTANRPCFAQFVTLS